MTGVRRNQLYNILSEFKKSKLIIQICKLQLLCKLIIVNC